MSLLDLFRAPRIVEAKLLHDPIALPSGRTAVKVKVEGAGTLIIGRERRRFRNGFDGVVMVPVALSVIVHAKSLFHKVQHELRMAPLPPFVLPENVPVPVRLPLPALPPIAITRFRITVLPRGPAE